MSLNPILVDG